MNKTAILAQVIIWLHNEKAAAVQENFWTLAKQAILADVYGIDTTSSTWDNDNAGINPALWFYACLHAGRVWSEDSEGEAAARANYDREVMRCGTSPEKRITSGQLSRAY